MKTATKPAFFSRNQYTNEGIYARFWKTKGEIEVYGCFDSFVHMTGEKVPLREFFDRVGITEKDCRRAFKQP